MTDVRVRRDGGVTVDGVSVGSVRRTTEGTTITSAIMGYPGPARWIPIDKDGKDLAGQQKTRRDAVAIVVKCSQPAVVSDMDESKGWYCQKGTIIAWVSWSGMSAGVHKRPDRPEWFADSFYPRGAFCPMFSNGAGYGVRAIADREAIDALNAALEEYNKGKQK